MNDGHRILRDTIKSKKRLLTEDEAIDIYTEHVLRDTSNCLMTVNGIVARDKSWVQIRDSGMQWYRFALGSLLIRGELTVVETIDRDNHEYEEVSCQNSYLLN